MKHKYTGKLPDTLWDEKRIEDQIFGVMERIKAMNREINQIQRDINGMYERKRVFQQKVSDAHLYINQLHKQKTALTKALNESNDSVR